MNRVVTAPTNGIVIPATMMYIKEYVHEKSEDWEIRFLLTAAIAMLYKMNASIWQKLVVKVKSELRVVWRPVL